MRIVSVVLSDIGQGSSLFIKLALEKSMSVFVRSYREVLHCYLTKRFVIGYLGLSTGTGNILTDVTPAVMREDVHYVA